MLNNKLLVKYSFQEYDGCDPELSLLIQRALSVIESGGFRNEDELFQDIPIILRVVRRPLQWKLYAEYLAFSRHTHMLNSIARE